MEQTRRGFFGSVAALAAGSVAVVNAKVSDAPSVQALSREESYVSYNPCTDVFMLWEPQGRDGDTIRWKGASIRQKDIPKGMKVR